MNINIKKETSMFSWIETSPDAKDRRRRQQVELLQEDQCNLLQKKNSDPIQTHPLFPASKNKGELRSYLKEAACSHKKENNNNNKTHTKNNAIKKEKRNADKLIARGASETLSRVLFLSLVRGRRELIFLFLSCAGGDTHWQDHIISFTPRSICNSNWPG